MVQPTRDECLRLTRLDKIVSRGQTVFFPFFFVVAGKGSGILPLAVLCRESPDLIGH